MLNKCSCADKYKAIFAPKCGCEMCELKWESEKSKKTNTNLESKSALAAKDKYCFSSVILPRKGCSKC